MPIMCTKPDVFPVVIYFNCRRLFCGVALLIYLAFLSVALHFWRQQNAVATVTVLWLVHPGCDSQSCNEHVCMQEYPGNHQSELTTHFLCMLPEAVAWSSRGGIATSYGILWICFPTTGPMAEWCYSSNIAAVCLYILTPLLHGTNCVLS